MEPGSLLALCTVGGLIAAAAMALAPHARRWWHERRYAELLEECFHRQPEHEKEHQAAHGGHFTQALREHNLVSRFQRKIHEARLPPLSKEERTRRVKEALRLRQ